MKFRNLILYTFIILVVFSGCLAISPKNNAEKITPLVLSQVTNQDWALEEVFGVTLPAMPKAPTLSFDDEEESLFGFSGINRYFGTFTIDSQGNLSISPIASTKMAGEEELMDLENRFTSRLEDTERWLIEGDHLILLGRENKLLLKFRPVDLYEAEDE